MYNGPGEPDDPIRYARRYRFDDDHLSAEEIARAEGMSTDGLWLPPEYDDPQHSLEDEEDRDQNGREQKEPYPF